MRPRGRPPPASSPPPQPQTRVAGGETEAGSQGSSNSPWRGGRMLAQETSPWRHGRCSAASRAPRRHRAPPTSHQGWGRCGIPPSRDTGGGPHGTVAAGSPCTLLSLWQELTFAPVVPAASLAPPPRADNYSCRGAKNSPGALFLALLPARCHQWLPVGAGSCARGRGGPGPFIRCQARPGFALRFPAFCLCFLREFGGV